MFNFCKYTSGACGNKTLNNVMAYYYIGMTGEDPFVSKCTEMSERDTDGVPETFYSINYTLSDPSVSAADHLVFTYQGGTCEYNTSTTGSITFEVLCNETKDTLIESDFSIDYVNDRCNPTVTFSHYAGCPIKATYYVEPEAAPVVTAGYPWLFAIFFIFLILMGPVINFFGKKFFRYLIGLTGLLLGGGLALTFIYASGELNGGTIGLYFIALFIILVSGGFLGYVLSTFLFAGLFVASAFSGAIAADLLFNLVFIGFL